jgi:predicted nuclease of predicted toxin-antitoxin system
MRLLLDQGLPRSTVPYLHNYGIEAVHVGDRGLATASDSRILNFGHQAGMVVVTLDADFHALLALSGLTGPSVIRIRIEGLRGEDLARLLVSVLQVCSDDLQNGAMVSVTENGIRIRRLPVTVK